VIVSPLPAGKGPAGLWGEIRQRGLARLFAGGAAITKLSAMRVQPFRGSPGSLAGGLVLTLPCSLGATGSSLSHFSAGAEGDPYATLSRLVGRGRDPSRSGTGG